MWTRLGGARGGQTRRCPPALRVLCLLGCLGVLSEGHSLPASGAQTRPLVMKPTVVAQSRPRVLKPFLVAQSRPRVPRQRSLAKGSDPCAGITCPSTSTCQSQGGAPTCVCPASAPHLVNSVCTAEDYPNSDFVDPHNNARAAVGSVPLVWDDSLAAAALQWTQHLVKSRRCSLLHPRSSPFGQNLAAVFGTMTFPSSNAINWWVAEGSDYSIGPFPESCAPGKVCGHYTQVVWNNTRQVGCAVATCPTKSGLVWACNYYPWGNVVGVKAFNPDPCWRVSCPHTSKCAASSGTAVCTCPSGQTLVNNVCTANAGLSKKWRRKKKRTTSGVHVPKVVNVFGDIGWVIPPDGFEWNAPKIYVGDTLNFTYAVASADDFHNLYLMAGRSAYDECNFDTGAVFMGNSSVLMLNLTAPGVYYFACSAFGYHCFANQKVAITALPAPAGNGTTGNGTTGNGTTGGGASGNGTGAASPPPPSPPPGLVPLSPPPPAVTTNTVNVYGDWGWRLYPAGQVWPQPPVHRGTVLNFTYAPVPGVYHNVLLMPSLEAWTTCNTTGAVPVGNGTTVLYTVQKWRGMLYFACNAFEVHCGRGHKVAINVTRESTSTSSPPPPAVSVQTTVNVYGDWGWRLYPAGQVWPQPPVHRGTVLNFTYAPVPGVYHNVLLMPSLEAWTTCNTTGAVPVGNGTTVLYKVQKWRGMLYFACNAFEVHCGRGHKVAINVTRA